MAKKGIGLVVMAIVLVLVGIPILQIISSGVRGTTTTYTLNNETITAPAEGASIDITGQELIEEIEVNNGSGVGAVPATNYSFGEEISNTTGLKTISFQLLDGEWAGLPVNLTYEFGADGYIESSAGRNVNLLVIIFGAIAIVLSVLAVIMKSDVMRILGR
jgi:hypothetical protein